MLADRDALSLRIHSNQLTGQPTSMWLVKGTRGGEMDYFPWWHKPLQIISKPLGSDQANVCIACSFQQQL
jgi:hypothetical protein